MYHRVLRIYTTNLNYPTNHWLPTLQVTAARTQQTIMSHQILESIQVPAFYMMIIYSNFHDLVASRYRFEYVDNCDKLGILNQTNDYTWDNFTPEIMHMHPLIVVWNFQISSMNTTALTLINCTQKKAAAQGCCFGIPSFNTIHLAKKVFRNFATSL